MKGYKVDFAKETVTVTKKFMEDAGVIGSAAFKEMMTLRKLGFVIVEREVKARKVNTISYAQMIQYMSLVENSNKYMATFNAMRAEAGSKNDRYNRVLKWFRATFPDFYAMGEADFTWFCLLSCAKFEVFLARFLFLSRNSVHK